MKCLCWICVTILLSTTVVRAQDQFNASGEVESVFFLSEEELPFWQYKNTNGFIQKFTGVGFKGSAVVNYKVSEKASLKGGVSIFYRDGVEQNIQRGNLFISYKRKYFEVTVGSKNPNLTSALSTSNQNILLSGNARAFPGIIVEAPNFINVSPVVALDYGLGHYILNDDRFVKNTKVHYKRLGVRFMTKSSGIFKASVQHFAQWGGDSPVLGELPSSPADFFKIFLARQGGDNSDLGEQANALGNHLGSFDLSYETDVGGSHLKLYHLHLFEDGSGTAFKNFPDGIWGVDYTFEKSFLLDKILYEYIDTRDQSGSSGRSGRDNYFSNKGYRSGWTYEGAIIGLPFFQLNPETGLGITNNRVVAHHLGASSTFNNFTILGKLTYLKSLGTYAEPFSIPQKSILSYVSTSYENPKFGTFLVSLGLDVFNNNTSRFALNLGYTYRIK